MAAPTNSAIHAEGLGSIATRRPSGSRPTTHPKAGTTNHTPAHSPTATDPGRSHSWHTSHTAADAAPANASERRM